MTKTEPTRATTELAGVDDVMARYSRPGPHATVIMQFPAPGQVGDDRMVRWHVRRSELVDAGAGDIALAHLDALVDSLEPRGECVLLTADDADATFCWLTDHATGHLAHVGPCPALVAAVDELTDRSPVIAAVVDHLGADVFELDHLHFTEIGSVKGDHVQTHRHTGGDQTGYQRRAEAVYERNADTIARQITEHAIHAGAHLVVLTGDDREAAAVTDHLDTHRFDVTSRQAGARHDPHIAERVRRAAIEQSVEHRRMRRAATVDHLREELGRQALAVQGRAATVAAISESRVATTFIDRSATRDIDIDLLARDTLLFGGTVVVTDDLGVTDGIAAVVRYATQ
jgi:hypothetical protein